MPYLPRPATISGRPPVSPCPCRVAELLRPLQAQRLTRRHGQPRSGRGEGAVASVRFVGRCTTSWCSARTSAMGTPQSAAAACSSMVRRRRRNGASARRVAHAARAVGVLVAVVDLVAGRLPDPHALPIGFQLVGNHHRQAGAHALAHFLAVAGDREPCRLSAIATKTSGLSTQPFGIESAPYFCSSAAKASRGRPTASTRLAAESVPRNVRRLTLMTSLMSCLPESRRLA